MSLAEFICYFYIGVQNMC